jgi:IS5 family transposase
LKEGSIIDAKMVKCSTGKKAQDGSKTKDPTASHTKKHGNIYHGHKAHIVTDKNGMVKETGYGTASQHDSAMADELFRKEKKAAMGDSAYGSKARESELKKRGVAGLFIAKRARGQKELTQEQKNHNSAISKVRVAVEQTFARLNKTGALVVARYRGLRKNAASLSWLCLAHNVALAASLQRRGVKVAG